MGVSVAYLLFVFLCWDKFLLLVSCLYQALKWLPQPQVMHNVTWYCIMVFALETVPGSAMCSCGGLCVLQELVFLWLCVEAGHVCWYRVRQACYTKMSEVRHSCWRCEDVFCIDGMVGCMQERETWLRCIAVKKWKQLGVQNFCQFHETTMT